MAAAARAFGVAAHDVANHAELRAALAEAGRHAGASVIVARITGKGLRERREALARRAHAVLEAG
jgi:thiamine pyrophosphate-dependent acetolactate synthase large subunit-like protein